MKTLARLLPVLCLTAGITGAALYSSYAHSQDAPRVPAAVCTVHPH